MEAVRARQSSDRPGEASTIDPAARNRIGLAIALAGPVALCAILLPLRQSFVGSSLPLVLVLPLVIAAILGGRPGGVIAAVMTVAAFDFFFTRPFYSLAIHGQDDVITTLVLLVVGLVVAELVVRTRRSERVAAERAARVESMRRVAGMGSANERPGWLITAAGEELLTTLGADEIVYRAGAPDGGFPVLGHGRITVPSGAPPLVEPDWAEGWTLALPVDSFGRPIGHFQVHFSDRNAPLGLSSDARIHAIALADTLGAGLARLGSRPVFN